MTYLGQDQKTWIVLMQFDGLTEPSDADKYIMHWNTGTSRWDQLTSSGSSGVVAATANKHSAHSHKDREEELTH